MKPVDFIKEVADFIGQPGAWTQHEVARDFNSVPVETHDMFATSWCALAAISRVIDKHELPHEYFTAVCHHVANIWPSLKPADEWILDQNEKEGQTQEGMRQLFLNSLSRAPARFHRYEDDHPGEARGIWECHGPNIAEIYYEVRPGFGSEMSKPDLIQWLDEYLPGCVRTNPIEYFLGDGVTWIWAIQFENLTDAMAFWLRFSGGPEIDQRDP